MCSTLPTMTSASEPLKNLPRLPKATTVQLLQDHEWQMSLGERAALEGLLAQVRPALAIEIGTAEGGSLRRLAAYSREVHSLDLVEPGRSVKDLKNVHLHTGDSHLLLTELLSRFAEQDRNVDFVLVDGDHSSEGVRRDVEDLLASPAISHTVIVLHDTMNDLVRSGLEQVEYEAVPKVAYVELDFVPGYMFREPSLRYQLWGGLGLLVVETRRGGYFSETARQDRYYEAYSLFHEMQPLVTEREASGQEQVGAESARIAELEKQLELHRSWLSSIENSVSWRITAPLRATKRQLRGRG